MVEVDQELAQLLSPSTFSLAECRAKSRAARTERDLKRILLGEKLVMESRHNRARAKLESEASESNLDLGTSTSQAAEPTSAAPQPIRNWTAQEAAKIEQGKKQQTSCVLMQPCASLFEAPGQDLQLPLRPNPLLDGPLERLPTSCQSISLSSS